MHNIDHIYCNATVYVGEGNIEVIFMIFGALSLIYVNHTPIYIPWQHILCLARINHFYKPVALGK